MEFRRLLKHATMNVVTMEKVVEEGDLSEPEPRERLPWFRRRSNKQR